MADNVAPCLTAPNDGQSCGLSDLTFWVRQRKCVTCRSTLPPWEKPGRPDPPCACVVVKEKGSREKIITKNLLAYNATMHIPYNVVENAEVAFHFLLHLFLSSAAAAESMLVIFFYAKCFFVQCK